MRMDPVEDEEVEDEEVEDFDEAVGEDMLRCWGVFFFFGRLSLKECIYTFVTTTHPTKASAGGILIPMSFVMSLFSVKEVTSCRLK